MQRATLVMLLLFNIKILSLNTIVYFKYIMMLAMYNKMISLHIHVMILPLIITNKCIMNDPTNRAFSTEYYLKGLKKVTE